MLSLFARSVAIFFQLFVRSLWPPRDSSARRSLKRVLIMLIFLPLFALVQLCHWFGFLLDELFFRGYRNVEVREPVFVTGVPRSGTTLVHRTLAADQQFTTFSTWECLFAPSVTQRKFIRLIGGIDCRIGAPLARLLGWAERKIFGALDDVHAMSLTEAEEDYLVLMPVMSCFILIVAFPYSSWLWDIGEFDRRLDSATRKRLMTYYRRCVQKHLYSGEPGRRFLSKNASFPPLLNSLVAEFPDARFVICLRNPLEVVPSQLSSLRDGMVFFDNDPYDPGFRDRIIEQLEYYYRNLVETPIPQNQRVSVKMGELQSDLFSSIEAIYSGLDIPMPDDYQQRLGLLSGEARDYRSAHDYKLSEFGLDAGLLHARFAKSIVELGLDKPEDVEQLN